MTGSGNRVNIVSEPLQQGFKASFGDVLRTVYNDAQVENLLLGNAGHESYKDIWGKIGEQETFKAARECNVSKFFMELPYFRQSLVEEFQKAAKNRKVSDQEIKVFADRFENDDFHAGSSDPHLPNYNISYWKFINGEKTNDFISGSLAPVLDKCSRYGVEARLVDFFEEYPLLKQKEEACDTAGYYKNEIEDFLKRNPEYESKGLGYWHDGYVLERDNNQRVCNEINGTVINTAKIDDSNVIGEIKRQKKEGENILVLEGDAHGARKDDMEENLPGKSLKMSLAPSYSYYVDKTNHYFEEMKKYVKEVGEDPPDLVYFIKEGIVATTSSTSLDVRKLIEETFHKVSDDMSEYNSEEDHIDQKSDIMATEKAKGVSI